MLQSDQVLLVHLLETVLPTLEIFLNSKPLILFYNLVGKGFVFLYHREKTLTVHWAISVCRSRICELNQDFEDGTLEQSEVKLDAKILK